MWVAVSFVLPGVALVYLFIWAETGETFSAQAEIRRAALELDPDNAELRERTDRANKVLANLEELKRKQREIEARREARMAARAAGLGPNALSLEFRRIAGGGWSGAPPPAI